MDNHRTPYTRTGTNLLLFVVVLLVILALPITITISAIVVIWIMFAFSLSVVVNILKYMLKPIKRLIIVNGAPKYWSIPTYQSNRYANIKIIMEGKPYGR